MTYLCIGYYVLIITALTLTECRKKNTEEKGNYLQRYFNLANCMPIIRHYQI